VARPVTPDRGCLWCNGVISPAKLQEEVQGERELRAQRYVEEEKVVAPASSCPTPRPPVEGPEARKSRGILAAGFFLCIIRCIGFRILFQIKWAWLAEDSLHVRRIGREEVISSVVD